MFSLIVPENKYGWREFSFVPAEANGKNASLDLLIVETDGSSYTQPLGYGEWKTTEIAGLPPYSINPIDWHKGLQGPFYAAGSYGWEKNTLNTSFHYVNWVSSVHIRWEFAGDVVKLFVTNNWAKNKVEELECKIVNIK